jgi:hypothetical protein
MQVMPRDIPAHNVNRNYGLIVSGYCPLNVGLIGQQIYAGVRHFREIISYPLFSPLASAVKEIKKKK